MTEDIKPRWSNGEVMAARALLGCAILILFALILPTLRHGMLMGGDDPIHLAYTIELDRVLQETGSVFGWTRIYGFGAPLFVFRPPGFYLFVQLIHMISFGQVPLLLAHKLTYALGILVYPVALYFLLGKFKFRPLVCGVGALLALAPISTWGHSLEAYYDLGLAKQVIAIPLFAFALGKLPGVVLARERLLPAALLFGCMFLCHPYMAWSFVLIALVYLGVVSCSGFDGRRLMGATLRVGGVIVCGSGLAAFWLVPFFMSSEIHPASSMTMRLVPLFDVLSETATATVSHFLDGSLYDRSTGPDSVFGGGKLTADWAWRDNSQSGRLPLLTGFCMAGAILCACRYRSKPCAFLMTGWLASLIIFMGPDDVPLLSLIPCQKDFQYVHFVAILDLFTICLAAVGVGGTVCLLLAGVQRLRIVQNLDRVPRHIVAAIVASLVLGFVTVNIYAERFSGSRTKLSNRSFELKNDRQTAWSLRNPQNRNMQDLTEFLAGKLEPFDRFYAHIPDIWHSPDVYHFSLAPAYIQRGNATAPVIANIMGGVNAIFGYGRLQEGLWSSEALLDLLRIRALVTQPDGVSVAGSLQPDFASGRWRVFLREGGGEALGCTESPPVLVVSDSLEWESVCMSWVQSLKTMDKEQLDGMPFLVRFDEDAPLFSLDSVSALYIADPKWDPITAFGQDAWEAFQRRQRPVFVRSVNNSIPTWGSVAVQSARQIAWTQLISRMDSTAEIEVLGESRHSLDATVRIRQSGLLYFKSAHYRGWRIEVDGASTPSFAISPGFTACRMEPGEHKVSFRYAGINGGGIGLSISVGTLLLLAGIGFRKRKGVAAEHEKTAA